MSHADVLIVGAGHAGAQVAIGLRMAKFAGSIVLLGDEPELPYERPPLSKDYFAGDKPFERLLLRPPSFWAERDVRIVAGERVTAVDAASHEVVTATGTRFSYRHLVWATGGRPRLLSCTGADLAGLHCIRTRADVDGIVANLAGVRSVVVIGGGYIGLEAAAVMSKLGKHVTVLEALPRVLARVCGEEISQFYAAEHRAHGVDLHTGAVVTCIDGVDGKVSAVRLSDGRAFGADMVIVGIGIVPAVEPLIAAGATGNNGVDVDEFCRTNLPDVYAIGDCAAHVNAFAAGARIRLESVHNANEQAATVVKSLCGRPTPYHSVPWFWSDQYDLKLQTIGLTLGFDRSVLRGDPTTRSFSVAYLRDGVLIALDCVNLPRDYVQGRKLIAEHARVDPVRLGDASVQLKDL